MQTQTTPTNVAKPVSPEPILKVAFGFMATKHLFAANELGIFEALAETPATLDALAARTGLTRRAARISADAMVALGLVECDGNTYRNSTVAAAFLSGRGPADLRPLLRHWDRISYPLWTDFATTLAKGPSKEIFEISEELQEIASAGIEAILAPTSMALPKTFDFSGCKRLLDVGGGTGSWSIAVARENPDIEVTVFELPAVAGIASRRFEGAGLGTRATVIAGDAMNDELPTGYDVFLLANIIHYWSPEQNQALLRRVRRAAEPGSALLMADFWTDPTHTKPFEAAMIAGEFAAALKNGDVYSIEEAQGWLGETGWRFIRHTPLSGPQSLIVAEAV